MGRACGPITTPCDVDSFSFNFFFFFSLFRRFFSFFLCFLSFFFFFLSVLEEIRNISKTFPLYSVIPDRPWPWSREWEALKQFKA